MRTGLLSSFLNAPFFLRERGKKRKDTNLESQSKTLFCLFSFFFGEERKNTSNIDVQFVTLLTASLDPPE